jgi:hypothetical protein
MVVVVPVVDVSVWEVLVLDAVTTAVAVPVVVPVPVVECVVVATIPTIATAVADAVGCVFLTTCMVDSAESTDRFGSPSSTS